MGPGTFLADGRLLGSEYWLLSLNSSYSLNSLYSFRIDTPCPALG